MAVKTSIKLPLRETARVVSIKLKLFETVSLLSGFVMSENVVSWHEEDIILIENVKSFITSTVGMVNKNHISIAWFGNPVPKVEIYRRNVDEEYDTIPYVSLPWNPSEYIMEMDNNSYVIKVVGANQTGEGQEFQIGNNQDYIVNEDLLLPINEKRYYLDIAITTEYRIEVNI